MSLVRVNVY